MSTDLAAELLTSILLARVDQHCADPTHRSGRYWSHEDGVFRCAAFGCHKVDPRPLVIGRAAERVETSTTETSQEQH